MFQFRLLCAYLPGEKLLLFIIVEIKSNYSQVIKTVQILLETLESRGKIAATDVDDFLKDPEAADRRSKVVEELVQTERRYVQDIEELCRYQLTLQSRSNVSQDIVHNLFPNLSQLIDLQRRILVAFEYHAQLPPSQQRFGSVFEILQDGFAVYEGYALNQKKAVDIATSDIDRLRLQPINFDFAFDLSSTLIKPIQRICKYPLLMQTLLKHTPQDWDCCDELSDGLETIKYITTEVNETQRRVENFQIVKDLTEQVRDWRGHRVSDFGDLLHDGKFTVVKSDIERDYHLYLFENIILCCKPAPPVKKQVLKKGNSSSSFTGTQLAANGGVSRKRESLVLKGRIYMAYITDVVASRSGGYMLHISWGRDNATDTGYFDIKFRHEEALTQWETTIKKMLARYQESRDFYQYSVGQNDPMYDVASTKSQSQQPSRKSYAESEEDYAYGGGSEADGLFSPISEDGRGARSMSTSSQFTNGGNGLQDEMNGLTLNGGGKPINGSHSSVSLNSSQSNFTAANVTTPYSVSNRNRSASQPNHPGNPGYVNMSSSYGDGNAAGRARSEGGNITAAQVSASALRGPVIAQPVAHRDANSGSQDSSSSSSSSMASRSVSGSFSSLTGTTSLSSTNGGNPMSSNPVSYISSSSTVLGGSTTSLVSTGGTTNTIISPVSQTGGPASQMKVKLHFQDDTFLLIVPVNIKYSQLVERLERKIRLCGGQTSGSLRMRYKDEDDDFVTIHNDEDIQMALELSHQETNASNNGKNINDTLTIWAA